MELNSDYIFPWTKVKILNIGIKLDIKQGRYEGMDWIQLKQDI
jgi:hypothetical protein